MTRPAKIISGGQTGADQGALFAARDLGIETGGTAPKGWRTEDGPAPWLAEYGLVEAESSNYQGRTLTNVRESDASVLFGDIESSGSALTIGCCVATGKPYLCNPDAHSLARWTHIGGWKVLNVAGNRESKNPGIAERVRAVLVEAFG